MARLQSLVARVNAQSVVLSEQAEQMRQLASRDGLTGERYVRGNVASFS